MSAKDKNTQGVSPYWVGGKTDDSEDMQAMWIPSSLSSHSGSTQAEEASEIHKTQTQGDPELFPQPSGQHQRKSTQVLSSRGISLKAMGNRANGKWSNNYISYSYDTLECFSWTQFHWPNLIKFSFSYFFSCFDHYCCFCSEIPRGTWGKGGVSGEGWGGGGKTERGSKQLEWKRVWEGKGKRGLDTGFSVCPMHVQCGQHRGPGENHRVSGPCPHTPTKSESEFQQSPACHMHFEVWGAWVYKAWQDV